MRLHTNFRDYYDSAIGFGIDEKVHYERVTRHVNMQIRPRVDWPTINNAGLLGFCGQVFPFVKLYKYEEVKVPRRYWNREIVDSFFAYSFDDYMSKREEWDGRLMYDYLDDLDRSKHRQFFVDWNFQSDETFLEHKVPSWVFRFRPSENETTGTLNPRLDDLQFKQLKDGVTVFQEISMYLSNILIEQKEVAVIEDKYRIQQHGFDLKDSFRNTKNRKHGSD